MPVAEILTGIALIKSATEIISKTVGAAASVSSVAGQIDALFEGSKHLKDEEKKARKNGQSVTEIVINQQLAAEHIADVKALIISRFGYYAWQEILQLKKDQRVEEKARATAKKRQQEEAQELVGDIAVVGGSILVGILCLAIVAAIALALI